MFKELYKSNLQLKGSQEERRQQLLEKQKDDRRCLQDNQRSLEEVLEEPEPDALKTRFNKDRRWQPKHEKLLTGFREVYGVDLALQQSEWLRECPSDISDWLLMPCPRGQRSLVVAYNRQTVVYNKVGRCVCVFRSLLPGDGIESGGLTILDCINVREQNSFYVLDVLAFGTQDLILCEAEFRFFWLRSKWSDYENLTRRGARNQKPFHLVSHYDLGGTFEEAFQSYPLWPDNKPELDGFLFYNRFAHYTCGTTPLVGWLFPFMVPDLLQQLVSEEYVKPENYTDPLSFMDEFDERLKAKWQRSREREDRKAQRMQGIVAHPAFDAEKAMALPLRNDTDSLPNDAGAMLEDAASDSDDENSLKKTLKSQMELELL